MLSNVYLYEGAGNWYKEYVLQNAQNVQKIDDNKIKIGDEIYVKDKFTLKNGARHGTNGDDWINPYTYIHAQKSENKTGRIKETDTVYAGAGEDHIGLLENTHIGYGESGNDVFSISNCKEAHGGSGDDLFKTKTKTHGGSLYGGKGNDKFEISSMAGQFIDGGEGKDIVKLNTKLKYTMNEESKDQLIEWSKLYKETGDIKYKNKCNDLYKEEFKKELNVAVNTDENGKEVFTVSWNEFGKEDSDRREVKFTDVEYLTVKGLGTAGYHFQPEELREMAGVQTPDAKATVKIAKKEDSPAVTQNTVQKEEPKTVNTKVAENNVNTLISLANTNNENKTESNSLLASLGSNQANTLIQLLLNLIKFLI